MTGWRVVHAVMEGRQDGPHASPKGVRHGFGVAAAIPLNLVQKWLGHAQLSTTAIYADTVGESRASRRGRGELTPRPLTLRLVGKTPLIPGYSRFHPMISNLEWLFWYKNALPLAQGEDDG
jgi:hypothetical protein